MITQSSTCRVCEGSFQSYFARQGKRYGRCSKCGAIIKIVTKDEYFNLGATYDPGDIFGSGEDAHIRMHLMVDTKKATLQAIEKRLERTKSGETSLKMLDVGCGMGGYLLAGRELGYEVSGVEPSPEHSAVGRELLNLPIMNAYFNASDFKEKAFDIVILSHVIEHIFDPRPFMEDLASVVKPGGILVVITPNAHSTLAQLTGRFWSMLGPVDHVTMMTPKSLISLKPHDFDLQVASAEILWEPAVVLLQAARDIVRTHFSKPQVAPNSQHSQGERSNSFRGTIAIINSNPVARALLSIASVPLWIFDRSMGRAHCLTGYYRRAV